MTSAVAATSNPSRLATARLSYRAEQAVTAIAVAGTSVLAVLSGAAPTGSATVDAALIILVCAVAVLAAGTAPWWMVALVAVMASALVASPALLCIGVAAAALALLSGHRHTDESALRSLAAGLVVAMLFRLHVGTFGVSAVVGLTLGVALIIGGIVGLDPATRRRLALASGLLGVLAVGLLAAIAIQARSVGRDASAAMSLTDEAVVALRAGDIGIAADKLGAAAERLEAAREGLAHPLMRPAAFIPVMAQHRAVGLDVTAAAADVADTAAAALEILDGDTLTVSAGSIDVDAIASLEEPVAQLHARLTSLHSLTESFDSPWLISPVRVALSDLGLELEGRFPDLERAVDVIQVTPDLLGAEGPRRYLLLFATPAEARAGGGFIGNYAEVIVDDGQISVGDFRRRSDLEAALQARPGTCAECPVGLVEQYGRFGFLTAAGDVDPRVWSNLTMSAHYPDVAETAAVLYPQSGGQPVDGVVVLDPFVVQALMQFTGPVELPQLGVVVAPDDAVDFIVRDQYLLAGDDSQDERIDGLAELGAQVIDELLSGELPPADELAETLAPFAGQRRLMAWFADDAEQALLATTEFAGALPEPGGAAFAVTMNNAAANKIDVFAESSVEQEVVEIDGSLQMIVSVTIANRAPATGLPHYVIGNEIGLDPGFSRTLITFYGPDGLVEATLDGAAIALERGGEAGWTTRRHFVDIAPGDSVSYRLVYAVDPSAEGDRITAEVAWRQPTASPS